MKTKSTPIVPLPIQRIAPWLSLDSIVFVCIVLALAGLTTEAIAQDGLRNAVLHTERIDEAVAILLHHLQGSFGALIMVSAGIGAMLGAAFGQYRASLSLLVVAVGSFILRSIIETFFNIDNVPETNMRD
jgi:hypothetical protein